MSGDVPTAQKMERSVSPVIATDRTLFTCPNCNALYQVVQQEAGPETIDREVTCRACDGPFPAREDRFVLKYFLLREDGRIRLRRRA